MEAVRGLNTPYTWYKGPLQRVTTTTATCREIKACVSCAHPELLVKRIADPGEQRNPAE